LESPLSPYTTLFRSLQSQQFDKAIDRFKKVVEQKPDAESYFYLATGYEKIGLATEAIAAYQKSKELAADPTLSQYIDRQIDALRDRKSTRLNSSHVK